MRVSLPVRVLDLAYVRFTVTDLDAMSRFLGDFGLANVSSDPKSLYMATADGQAYAYAASGGTSNRFVSIGLNVESRADLQRLVDSGRASAIRECDGPGAGLVVEVVGPDGITFEVVAGRQRGPEAGVRAPFTHNFGRSKVRRNASQRPPKGRTPALRLGHCALRVSDAVAAAEWLTQTFGFRASDYLVVPEDPSRVVGVFMRCDRGASFVDHHTLFVSSSPAPGLHHYSFEVQDVDAVMSAHDWLLTRGHTLEVGVGRHMAGSQVFDYWIEPSGFRTEHYADGDVANCDWQPGRIAGDPVGVTQWGPVPPHGFFE